MSDPYDILDRGYHVGRRVREYFARRPGRLWYYFGDLPEATDDALWQRDGHILVDLNDEELVVQAAGNGNERVVEPEYDACCTEPDASTR